MRQADEKTLAEKGQWRTKYFKTLGQPQPVEHRATSGPAATGEATSQFDPTTIMKRIALFLGTTAVALAEWLMFELLRTPYNPPRDMLTLLGTEKYGLVAFMAAMTIVWALALIWILATARLTLRDYFGFLTLVAFFMGGMLYMVKNPHRAVTPWELLWS